MITAIGTAMIAVLAENECKSVLWGDCALLDAAFYRSGSKARNDHPLRRWQHVLNALDRDSRFEKDYIHLDLGWKDAKHPRFVRYFTLKEISTCPTIPN